MDRFNVVVFDRGHYWHYERRDLDAETSVVVAKRLTDSNEHESVIITDADDFTCFRWERGRGVVFPPLREGPSGRMPSPEG